jgi:hypothetical protein
MLLFSAASVYALMSFTVAQRTESCTCTEAWARRLL